MSNAFLLQAAAKDILTRPQHRKRSSLNMILQCGIAPATAIPGSERGLLASAPPAAERRLTGAGRSAAPASPSATRPSTAASVDPAHRVSNQALLTPLMTCALQPLAQAAAVLGGFRITRFFSNSSRY